jgi:dihydrofolate reductase
VVERVLGNMVEETGAVIMGRRTYDNSIKAWAGKGPLGEVPCFVVTHKPPASSDPVFTFVTDGVERALAKAREVADGNLVNVLLGGGRRLFDQLPQRVELEQAGLSQTDGVTHLEYRVVR